MSEQGPIDAELLPQTFWHFTRTDGFSQVLWNAFLSKGIVMTTSQIARMPGLEAAMTIHDFAPQLGPFEAVLEDVRAREFGYLPSRKGAFFLFDEAGTADTYGRYWLKGAPYAVLRARVFRNSSLHRGHLGWMNNPSPDQFTESARGYWSGHAHPRPPSHWEYVVDGCLYFPDWQSPPFGQR